MLSAEENERLCQVGPGTPMGEALRRYWVPAFQLGDLPAPDAPPIHVRVLAQDLVAFRDTDGRYGLLDEFCCHRNASLVYGRVEDHGIRCLYHGWKYDVEGRLLEMPNCEDERLRARFRQGAYPVVPAGGLGWTYLGPLGTEPAFPRFFFNEAAAVAVSELVFDCSWVQIQEGSLDSSHVGILHLDTLTAMRPGVPREVGSLRFDGTVWDQTIEFPPGVDAMPSPDNAPSIELEATPFGFHYAALRRMPDPAKRYVRVTAFGFPFTSLIGGSVGAVIVVPRDDETCSFLAVRPLPPGAPAPPPTYAPSMPATATTEVRPHGSAGEGAVGWTNDPTETRRYRLPPQDRRAMAARASYAGFLGGNRPQDAAVQGVNGRAARFSRANENLVPADAAVIRFRRLLLEAARAVERGGEPPARGEGFDFTAARAAAEVVDAGACWQELVPGNGGQRRPLASD